MDVKARTPVPWILHSWSAEELFTMFRFHERASFRFRWTSDQKEYRIRVPHWALATVAGGAAVVLKPKPRLRFSLFDAFATTTFAASLAGVVAWLIRLRA
jgi:hypothetical protein